ncbi:M14 family metallopeptidase [Alteromonas facilis]|uniref:M14 family metallopeptidase n=1 Tax=Alteromonas facilis TaxID=2048004 RepID=UPI000C28CC5D|nr:M14-type cytosolic carboxypeptidase [Alteromonas facilis]
MMRINSEFCGGAIEVVQAEIASNIKLKIPKDNQSCTRQWFYFSLETSQPTAHHIALLNAGQVSFQNAWDGYEVFVSYDNEHWFTVATRFDGESLSIEHDATSTTTYYAYFVPYPLNRQAQQEKRLLEQSHIHMNSLVTTASGNNLNLLTIGDIAPHKKNVWLIARQHPGESMAQWISEGITHALSNKGQFASLFDVANVFVVMNMNPDGSQIGNHRTNALGKNLNRCWSEPSVESCPEVFAVQQAMSEYGVDFFVDIHGDESIPYNFIMSFGSGDEGEVFKQRLAKLEPHFQLAYDYATYANSCTSGCGTSSCSQGKTATTYVAQAFDAVSLLLEASFKPLQNRPQGEAWDHHACRELGQNLVQSLADHFKRNSN